MFGLGNTFDRGLPVSGPDQKSRPNKKSVLEILVQFVVNLFIYLLLYDLYFQSERVVASVRFRKFSKCCGEKLFCWLMHLFSARWWARAARTSRTRLEKKYFVNIIFLRKVVGKGSENKEDKTGEEILC